MTKPIEEFWLIWSHEHQGWWQPNQRGYTRSRKAAGRYTRAEAEDIVRGANKYHIAEDGPPFEAMVPVPEDPI